VAACMENAGLQVLAHYLIGLAPRVKLECEPCLPVFGVHPIDACVLYCLNAVIHTSR